MNEGNEVDSIQTSMLAKGGFGRQHCNVKNCPRRNTRQEFQASAGGAYRLSTHTDNKNYNPIPLS
eukprot:scaffold340886_cov79-Cyclotella_meneghiniana.AAC.1